MKKILLSLIIIGAVGAVVAGVTTAYFSDTETAVGNTITAGTIDIKVNDANPWSSPFTIGDLKPGETDYMNLGIENVGTNPAEIYKSIKGMIGAGGNCVHTCSVGLYCASSQPECLAENGTPQDEIQTQIFYDLSVKIYASKSDYTTGKSPVWWQTIETGDQTLDTVYPDDITSIDLGMLPVGGYMFVEQSYHFNETAGNIYQGDVLTFNMEVEARQLAQSAEGNATVTLENKGGAPDWAIISGDDIQGTLTYKTKGPSFDYDLVAKGLTNNGTYRLIYYSDPWNNPEIVTLIGGVVNANNSGVVSLLGQSVNLNKDLPESGDANYPLGAKIWLVPTASLTGSTLSWTNTGQFLFDTSLITYDDTDL